MVEPVDGGRATLALSSRSRRSRSPDSSSRCTPARRASTTALLDLEWRVLRSLASASRPRRHRSSSASIAASVNAIPAPPELWHEPLARALARIAAAKPRAIGLDYPLPERSYDAIHPGLDRALFTGLAAAVENGPFVATLNIDSRTRTARNIHTPFLALLGDSRLGIGLIARDGDGVTRRFSLLVPTEDGGFPTLVGRLCRALGRRTAATGSSTTALGHAVRSTCRCTTCSTLSDPALLSALFRDRIVLIGETQPYADRHRGAREPRRLGSGRRAIRPGVVVHAQTLRTAMLAASAPGGLSPAAVILAVPVAALPFVAGIGAGARRGRRVWASLCSAPERSVSLRSGLFIPIAAPPHHARPRRGLAGSVRRPANQPSRGVEYSALAPEQHTAAPAPARGRRMVSRSWVPSSPAAREAT